MQNMCQVQEEKIQILTLTFFGNFNAKFNLSSMVYPWELNFIINKVELLELRKEKRKKWNFLKSRAKEYFCTVVSRRVFVQT